MPTEHTADPHLYPMAEHIEQWPIERLVPYSRNARTHSDAHVAQIAGSIAAFGFLNPILVDTQAGVLAGHGRLLAARKLQLEQVPVIVLDHLSETQKRFIISRILSEVLQITAVGIHHVAFSVPISFGFKNNFAAIQRPHGKLIV